MKIITRYEYLRKKKQIRNIKIIVSIFLIIATWLLIHFNFHKINFSTSISIPIITYHDITLDESSNTMQVTKDKFKEDMEYLKSHGYTPLLANDFISILNGDSSAPLKPIVITFDDGYLSNYEYAFPVLKETNMKAIISVIASNIRDGLGNGLVSFMSWEQCKEMYESGLVGIENHTYNLHNPSTGGLYILDGANGIQKNKGESKSDYYERVKNDLYNCTRLIEENVGNKVSYFAYPYGQTERWAYDILEEIGIDMAVITKGDLANTQTNKLKLPRLSITTESSMYSVLPKDVAKYDKGNININGEDNEVNAYKINGNYYLNIIEVAEILSNSNSGVEFNINWDSSKNTAEWIIGDKSIDYASDEYFDYYKSIEVDSYVYSINCNNKTYNIECYNIGDMYYIQSHNIWNILGLDVSINSNGSKITIKN